MGSTRNYLILKFLGAIYCNRPPADMSIFLLHLFTSKYIVNTRLLLYPVCREACTSIRNNWILLLKVKKLFSTHFFLWSLSLYDFILIWNASSMAAAAVLNLICFGDAKKCNSDTELCDLSLFGASNLSAFFQSTICHGHLINVVFGYEKKQVLLDIITLMK